MDSTEFQNIPNESLMFTAFSPTLGYGAFQVMPPGPGEVGRGFPTIPYLSLEALLYQQMSSNPASSPFNTLSGSNTGQQIIGGQLTQQDSTGTSRYQQGYQSRTN